MVDRRSPLSEYRPADRHLRYVGAGLVYLVASIHLFHPERGFPRLVLLVATDNVALLLGDPRPLLFVISGVALVGGTLLVARGFPRRPLYAGGIALMCTYILGYFAWHLSGHGGFLPGREPLYHGLTPLQAVVDHLRTYPVARLSKLAETLLLVVLVVLYRREE
ncbi:hypothetical protein ACFQJD_13100 [Haloplanus sp. GCM10025708]|uniref:hypothetical protein n=1 Tax=Haloferacaceae TaxID=1644056 RepID=UPI00361F4FC4